MRQTLATGVVALTDPGDDVAPPPLEDGAAPVLAAAGARPEAGVGVVAGPVAGLVPGFVTGLPAVGGVRSAARPPTGAGTDGPADGESSGLAAAVTGASALVTGARAAVTGVGRGAGKPMAWLMPALLMTSPPMATATAVKRPKPFERSIEATPSSCS
ncbi:MAG TPA: hypothetical protein VGN19_08040 [Pedococcus sp.]|nr:hypothetical protein [Pedococcus sp.]